MTWSEAKRYGEDYLKDLVCAVCKVEDKHKDFARMSINALEKQIAKKPKERDCIGFNTLTCPVCKEVLYLYEPYCDNCGQAIDWSDEE